MCLQGLWRPEEDLDSLELKLQVLVPVWLLGTDSRSEQQAQCKESMRQRGTQAQMGRLCRPLLKLRGHCGRGEEGLQT